MTAYIAIATAIIVVVIALVAWLLHKKIDTGFKWLASDVHYTSIHISDEVLNIKAHTRERTDNITAAVLEHLSKTRRLVAESIDHTTKMVTSAEDRLHNSVKSVATDLKSHASAAVHKAIGDLHGVRHEVCDLCGKLSNAWTVTEGKVICADCQIRKNS